MSPLLPLAAVAFLSLSAPAHAVLIAYWDQNSSSLPSGSLGFTPSDFPQAADRGTGALALAQFNTATAGDDGAYTAIQRFSGDELNAQQGAPAGQSLSPLVGASVDGAFSNNGMSILLSVSTAGFEDIRVSWAQRGTATGFTSREFLYSTDGVSFTSFETDTGVLSSTWTLEAYDLSAISEVENAPSVVFAIKLDGGTNASGNNRFDNITIEGTATGGALGDYNNDGSVDAADYTTWRDNLDLDGSALANRAPSQTGPVDATDYSVWAGAFGQPAVGAIGAAAVPEPGALLIALSGGLALVGCRRRRVC
ncbi:hypothetical protein Pla175_47470 [Pirellulimonas nuda]|uniref:PEP-CTERM protein-sorting domain-containing protein n=1 Tax=Pirellulimonas nuda TaxID=2528009 RepID=A0A518DIN5_9BACT|nr:hypothetical protein [Pirellulimonas nuda]QDU91326.1 hypothetical protein Pla175_47470 [Pirellulimonas nuda]